MSNITMSLDDDLIKKIRKIAIDKNTTLTGIIRDHLTSISEKEDLKKENIISELQEIYKKTNAVVGEKSWSREELHER